MRILEFDNLLGGFQTDVVSEPITVAANQELSVGQVFALNEKGQAVAMTKTSSAKDVYGIMADAIATSADETKPAVCYKRGEFNVRKIILPADTDAVPYHIALSNIGITLRNTVPADPQKEE